MHLADAGSPVTRFRAGLDNPQGLLKTRPEGGEKILGIVKRRQRRVYLPERRLHKRYLSIIAGALSVCAAAHNRIARCAISLRRSLLQISAPNRRLLALCVTMRVKDPHTHPHPNQSPKKGGFGGGETVSALK